MLFMEFVMFSVKMMFSVLGWLVLLCDLCMDRLCGFISGW